MAKTEVKISGFGGQGIILSAMIVGKAVSIFDNKYATLIQSFGPEARGSSCSAQVILSDEPINYPYIKQSNILVALSQEAYTKFIDELLPGGILITEEDLVKVDERAGDKKHFSIPATRIAEELGRTLVLNIVMVGFITAVSQFTAKESAQKAVEDSVPPGTESLNLRAFLKGYDYGRTKYFG